MDVLTRNAFAARSSRPEAATAAWTKPNLARAQSLVGLTATQTFPPEIPQAQAEILAHLGLKPGH